MSVFENCGLIQQIENATWDILHEKLNDKVKSLPNFYPNILEKMKRKAFGKVEWELYFTVNKIEPLNKGIKEGIIERFDSMSDDEMNQKMIDDGVNDENIYIWTLLELHIILSWYLYRTVESYQHKHFRAILKYYNFIRSEIEKRGLLIPNGLNKNPLEKYWKNREVEQERQRIIAIKEGEVARRLCPHCGARGKDVKKHSANRYMCNICGKTFKKIKS